MLSRRVVCSARRFAWKVNPGNHTLWRRAAYPPKKDAVSCVSLVLSAGGLLGFPRVLVWKDLGFFCAVAARPFPGVPKGYLRRMAKKQGPFFRMAPFGSGVAWDGSALLSPGWWLRGSGARLRKKKRKW